MAQSHPSDHLPHTKFSTAAFASSSPSAPASSPSPSSSDILPTQPPTTNSQAFDVGPPPHHLHHFTNPCSTRANADGPAQIPSHFYLHPPQHQHHHHQNEQRLPISHHHETHIKVESALSMNNDNETESPGASSKSIIEQALRSYAPGGIASTPSAPSRYCGSVHGARGQQPPRFLHPQEASNRFFPGDSPNPLKGGFPPTDRTTLHSLSIREEGSPNIISGGGPLNNDNVLIYAAESIQTSKGGFLTPERTPYPLSKEEGSANRISISTPASNDADRNARLAAISHSHSRFKPNSSPSPHIDHQPHHSRVAMDISSEHRENTSFPPPTHSIPDIEVAPSGNLPPSFPLSRNPFISNSIHMESGHELIHGTSTTALLRHGGSSLAGFLSQTNNDGSSSGNSSDDGSYERQVPPPVAAAAIHHRIKEPSPYFEGYTWDEAGNVMTGSANSAMAAYNRKIFRDTGKYYTGPTLVDSQKGNILEHGGLINHFTLSNATSPESSYFPDRLSADSIPCRTRAKRGCATHPRSIAERVRRTKISERMKKLQELVPNMDKHTNTAEMLDEAVEYVKGLQHQVKELTEAQAKCSCSYNNTGKNQ